MEQSGTGLIELKIAALSASNDEKSYAVVLDAMWIPLGRMVMVMGTLEAQQLALALEVKAGNMTVSVRFMADLLIEAYNRFNYQLDKIIINSLKDGVFGAVLCFKNGDDIVEVISRPSDALVLAVKCDSAICITPDVFEQVKLDMNA